MAKKLDKVVGSNAILLSTKSHNLLIKRSHTVTYSHITNKKRYRFISMCGCQTWQEGGL